MKNLKVLGIFLTCILCLSGCTPKPIENGEDNTPIQISLIEGSGGTAYGILANGIASTIETSYPGSLVQIMLGNPADNSVRINKYEADFALVSSGTAYNSFYGLEGSEKLSNIRVVASFNPSVAHFVIDAKYGITTFEQFIAEKPKIRFRHSAGALGTMFTQLLAEYGLTIQDMENWGAKLVDVEQAVIPSMMAEGALDAYFTASSLPSSLIVQTFANKDLNLISFSEEVVEAVSTKYGYKSYLIPKESYSFIDEDVLSISLYVVLIAHDKVPDEKVYKLSKAINDNLDYMRTVLASLSEFTSESYTEAFIIPIHPGAQRYYQEIGILE